MGKRPQPANLAGFGGRKPGQVNRTTRAVKQALVEAFDKLGGVSSLVKWAKEEPTEFYKLWAKLLPTELTANVSVTHNLAQQLEAVAMELRQADDGAGRTITIN